MRSIAAAILVLAGAVLVSGRGLNGLGEILGLAVLAVGGFIFIVDQVASGFRKVIQTVLESGQDSKEPPETGATSDKVATDEGGADKAP